MKYDHFVATVQLSIADAKALTQRIRAMIAATHLDMDELQTMVIAAREGLAWQALGFHSWTAYLADIVRIDITAERRREVVALLIPERISQRALAKMLDVSQSTIRNDWKFIRLSDQYSPDLDSPRYVTGLDNRNYPVRDEPLDPPPPPPELVKLLKRATRKAKSLCEDLVDSYCNPDFLTKDTEIEIQRTALAVALADLDMILWPTRPEIKAKRRKRDGRSRTSEDGVIRVQFNKEKKI